MAPAVPVGVSQLFLPINVALLKPSAPVSGSGSVGKQDKENRHTEACDTLHRYAPGIDKYGTRPRPWLQCETQLASCVLRRHSGEKTTAGGGERCSSARGITRAKYIIKSTARSITGQL